MPDVHVICDAPIGCFNLVATAVPDYTDAIPHIENITPSVMREQEVTMLGTAGAVRRAVEAMREMHPEQHVVVVSTAESEMISSDHGDWLSKMEPPVPFFWSKSLEGDEWEGRDRVLLWLWKNFGLPISDFRLKNGDSNRQSAIPKSSISSARRMAATTRRRICTRLKRLIEGAGGTVNLVYPMEATSQPTRRAWPMAR